MVSAGILRYGDIDLSKLRDLAGTNAAAAPRVVEVLLLNEKRGDTKAFSREIEVKVWIR